MSETTCGLVLNGSGDGDIPLSGFCLNMAHQGPRLRLGSKVAVKPNAIDVHGALTFFNLREEHLYISQLVRIEGQRDDLLARLRSGDRG